MSDRRSSTRRPCADLRPVALACSLSVLLFAAPAVAQTKSQAARSVPIAAAEGGRLWFVELVGKPVADGASLSEVQLEKSRFRSAARAAGVRYTERMTFDTLFNGFSIDVSPTERDRIARLPGVKAMYPVEVIERPAVEVSDGAAPDLAAAIHLTGVAVAQNQLGLSGKGIKVGVIDSGIDHDHPAFGGSGTNGTTPFPTARVVAGWDFVGDNYNSTGTPAQQIPQPDANPDDCGGHGTHVAGIVGANGAGLVGVAPQVSLAAYRVFGCSGTSSADIIVAALERALADGMKVVNQSLGAARQWPQYPTAQASARMAAKGVVMVASIGNNGPGGTAPDALFAAGAPGVGDGVIGVASFDNGQRSFNVGSDIYGFNVATGAPLPPTSGSLPLARTGTPATTDDACPPWESGFGGTPWQGGAWLPAGSLTGSAVLIRRGTCSFYSKALNASRAGASAMMLYNNAAGSLSPTVAAPTGMPPITMPVGALTQPQGVALNNTMAAGPASLTWSAVFVGFPFGTGGLISGFSSFGLNAELTLKPQLGAPGGGIFSTYPLESGGTATLSGTSMSSPHIAGAAALILEAIPNAAMGGSGNALNPAGAPPAVWMVNRLQNTATPQNLSSNASSGLADFSHRQGGGMLNVVRAIQDTAFVVPSQISLGESEAGPRSTTLTLRNLGNTARSFTLGHRAAAASGPNTTTGTSFNISSTVDSPATVSFSVPSITVPAKGSAAVTVTIEANAALVNRGIYGGYVLFTPDGPGEPIRVPYAGFKGDYQSTVILTPTTNNYPWLAKPNGTNYDNCNAAACSFTMAPAAGTTPADMPHVVAHLDHHARTLRIEAFDASGASVGRVSEVEYQGRNSTPTAFFAFAWNGTTDTAPGGVPNGAYTLRLSVLKALGDPANPAHWETWASPTAATIARPPTPTRGAPRELARVTR